MITNRPERSRYEIAVEDEVAGFVDYHRFRDEIALLHTEIDSRWEGQGLAGQLVRHVLDEARRNGLQVLPYCPFVRGWIGKHTDYVSLIPESQHERFGF